MKKFFIVIILVIGFSIFAPQASAATLILSPSSGNVTAGQTITVDIMLDTKNADIDGVDVYSLHYNPAILEVVDSSSSASGIQITPGSLFPITLTNKVTSGVVQFSQVTSGGTSYKGAGKLATITFKGLSNGTSAVTFDFTPGSTSDTNVAGGGKDELTSVGSGSYTVTGGGVTPPPPPPVDTTAPVISAISSSGIKSSSVNIVWTTDESSDTVVEYGLTTSYGSLSTNSSLLTLHSRSLVNLKSNTLYHFRVKSKDAAGNLAVSTDKTFTTLAGSSTPPPPPTPTPTPTPGPGPAPRPTPTPSPTSSGTGPRLSSIYALEISDSSAIISWKTDRPSDSKVEYGKTDSYESSTEVNSSFVTSHSFNLSNLSSGTTYHYRVRSIDESGNLTFSGDRTFTTINVIENDMNFFERIWDWFISLFV
ncbi:MAG: glycoside hydrolase family protein [Parcubacteria group bacterium Gr01-1014_46]|nr:MAG: glycoside hydrolase family protein [Parcubacteria group bacterium Gr01-1014_46]